MELKICQRRREHLERRRFGARRRAGRTPTPCLSTTTHASSTSCSRGTTSKNQQHPRPHQIRGRPLVRALSHHLCRAPLPVSAWCCTRRGLVRMTYCGTSAAVTADCSTRQPCNTAANALASTLTLRALPRRPSVLWSRASRRCANSPVAICSRSRPARCALASSEQPPTPPSLNSLRQRAR